MQVQRKVGALTWSRKAEEVKPTKKSNITSPLVLSTIHCIQLVYSKQALTVMPLVRFEASLEFLQPYLKTLDASNP